MYNCTNKGHTFYIRNSSNFTMCSGIYLKMSITTSAPGYLHQEYIMTNLILLMLIQLPRDVTHTHPPGENSDIPWSLVMSRKCDQQ